MTTNSDMFVILISKSIFKKFLQSQLIRQLIDNYRYVRRNMHIITDVCPSVSDFHSSITYSLLGVEWQGWYTGESAHFPSMCPEFNSRTVLYVACFIVLLVLVLLLQRFSSATLVFFPPQKPASPNSDLTIREEPHDNQPGLMWLPL